MIDFIAEEAKRQLRLVESRKEYLQRSLGISVLEIVAKGGDMKEGVDQFLADSRLKPEALAVDEQYWKAIADYAERLKQKKQKYEKLKGSLNIAFTNSDDPKMAWDLCELKGLACATNAKDDLYRFVDELEPGLSEKFKGSLVPHIPQPIACQRVSADD
jgi:hypothetical protein